MSEALQTTNANLPALITMLFKQGFLEAELVEYIRDNPPHKHRDIIEEVVTRSGHGSIRVAAKIAETLGYPMMSLEGINKDALIGDVLDDEFVSRNRILPLHRRNRILFVALADPTDFEAIQEIRYLTGLTPEPVIVPHDQLLPFVGENDDLALPDADSGMFDINIDDLDVGGDDELDESVSFSEDDAPIIRFVNKILVDAIRQGASDIHCEPYDKKYRIRYRVDGVLHVAAEPPYNLGPRITARIKIMAKLDISERRIPQDGKIKLKFHNSSIDFRVNTTPTIHGEKSVLRILDSSAAKLDIDVLGLDDHQKHLLMKNIRLPQGMVLVTGPTGSGKTVTIYSSIRILNRPEVNISTAEDPVEIQLPGINQVHINNKVGLTFASALRAFLRQDPDIVMIGEIRDFETAEVAVKAAQTGHLLLSTLHTNSAAETLARLRNIGIEPYNIAATVELIIAQRLGRKLCTNCKTVYDKEANRAQLLTLGLTEAEIDDEEIVIYAPVGCNVCTKGYKGRIGFFEFMDITPELEEMIISEATAPEMEKLAMEQGMISLRDSALIALRKGITSIDEVQRVTV